jgi:polyisoprenoid-binding protein YceI
VTDRFVRKSRNSPETGAEAARAFRALRIPKVFLTHPEKMPADPAARAYRSRRAAALRSLFAAWALLSGLLFLAAALLATAAGRQADAARIFVADPGASHVRIKLGRAGLLGFLGHDHLIEAPIAEGRIEVGSGGIGSSRVAFRFRAADLAVVPGTEPAADIPEVEKRMRGPEVLDVERHPQIAFDSTAVLERPGAGGELDLRVRGWLALRGRRHDIEVPVRVRIDGDSLSARGEVELRLRDLGIEPPSVARVVNVANRFTIAIDVRARRAASSPSPAGDVPAEAGQDAAPGANAAACRPGSRTCTASVRHPGEGVPSMPAGRRERGCGIGRGVA